MKVTSEPEVTVSTISKILQVKSGMNIASFCMVKHQNKDLSKVFVLTTGRNIYRANRIFSIDEAEKCLISFGDDFENKLREEGYDYDSLQFDIDCELLPIGKPTGSFDDIWLKTISLVKDNFLRTGKLESAYWFLLPSPNEGRALIIRNTMGEEYDKDVKCNIINEVLNVHKCTSWIMVSEVFVGKNVKIQPSKDPDRKEAIFIIGQEMGRPIRQTAIGISRDVNGKVIGLYKLIPDESSSDVFMEKEEGRVAEGRFVLSFDWAK